MKRLREIGTPKATAEHAATKDPAAHSISVLNGQLAKAVLRCLSAISSTCGYCIIIAALLAPALRAAPFPWIRYWDFLGPRAVIANHRSVYTFAPQLAFHFTVNGSTGVATVTGGTYPPVNGDIFWPDGGSVNTSSGGNLPSSLVPTLTSGMTTSDLVAHLSSTANMTNGDNLLIGLETMTCVTISGNDCAVSRYSNVNDRSNHSMGDVATDTNTGLYTISNGLWPVYAVCSAGVSGAGTFVIRQTLVNYVTPDPCTGTALVVSSAGTATLTGSLITGTNIYLDSDPTGFPMGTTFAYKAPSGTDECNHTAPLGGGTKPYSPGGGRLCAFVSVPANATPGTYTTTWTVCSSTTSPCPSGASSTFSWDIDVIAEPNITFSPPGSFTTPTALADYDAMMVARPCPGSACGTQGVPSSYSGIANYIDPLAAPVPINQLGAGISGGLSMYGWNLPCDNLAIYTGNPIYRTGCFADGMGHGPATVSSTTLSANINPGDTSFTVVDASNFVANTSYPLTTENLTCTTVNTLTNTISGCNAAAFSHSSGTTVSSAPDLQSVRTYVNANPLAPGPDYMHFTEPSFRAARVLGDSSYLTVAALMQNSTMYSLGLQLDAIRYRPVAWALADCVAQLKYGLVTGTYCDDIRDGLYSQALRATDSSGAFYQQNFINGLACYEIIADYQLSHDPRAPYLCKRVADRIWADYDQANHIWMNLVGPDFSPWCNNSTLWFQANGIDGNCGIRPLSWQQLQFHGVNSNWWYYAFTGDTTYRDRGDDLFNHVLDDVGASSGYPLSGKNNSEIGYTFFNAVAWRTGTQGVNGWYGDAVPSISLPGNIRLSGHLLAAIKDLDRKYLPNVRLLAAAKHE